MSEALIVGAGIGGLAVAHALTRTGWTVRVIERSPGHQPVGAGIILGPNAVAALNLLGLDVAPVSREVAELLVADRWGEALQRIRWRADHAVALSRRDLHAVLAEGVEVEFGQSFDPDVHAADLVIGADGLHSQVRKQIGLDSPLRYSGYTCWRALVPDPGVGTACEYWGSGTRVGLVPLPGNQVYVYLVRNAAAGDPGPETAAQVAQLFEGYADPVPAVLEQVAQAELLHHDLFDLPRRAWGGGAVWLLGDAAHAMLPNQGQGAGMAIEDALAVAIAVHGEGLGEYVRLRDARVAAVQKDSYRIGRIAQVEGDFAVTMRNRISRALPDRYADRASARLVEPGLELVDLARPLFA